MCAERRAALMHMLQTQTHAENGFRITKQKEGGGNLIPWSLKARRWHGVKHFPSSGQRSSITGAVGNAVER